ncbi:hypothetical protein JSE7799_00748 [Jannaschia seosinensis]|uniref:Uncharacterized protein n=1 Tax=Jannaschia seosinensis TaxID=313367 RepID=A0A0M7B7U2_9RHOB|nr:hypothetical protein [Jannaschia seosinensis]CUH26738.1 hypothetical protein JSE7799_00748 [Jannaschia seosinensis]
MTVLRGIERLEAPAIWHPGDGPARDVYAVIGEAELVLQDREGTALAHWSLPALSRRNPGEMPARFSPVEGSDEVLEVEDTLLADALERVVAAVERGRQKPGALRRVAVGIAGGFAVGLLLLWLPGAMRGHAGNVMPPAQRVETGERLLEEIARVTGPVCASPLGDEALGRLRDRLFPTTPVRLMVVRGLPEPALALPGGLIAVSGATLIAQDDPLVVAGHVLAAALMAESDPPLARFLSGIGARDLATLLFTGTLTDRAVAAHVETLLSAPPPPLDAARLQSGFAGRGLAWAPYAAVRSLPIGEAPPSDMPAALDDTAWLALREICET